MVTYDNSEVKKAEGTKKCVMKTNLEFENYKSCSEATQLGNEKNIQKKEKQTQIVPFATQEKINNS